MPVQQLLPHVPPIAHYRRLPLDDADNALCYWDQAASLMVLPDDGLCSVQDGSVTGSAGEADADRIRALLDHNRETFELLHQGARRRRIQFPELEEEGGSVDEHAESMAPLGELAQLWFLLAQSKMIAGHVSGAASELVGLGQMGHILCCGEGLVMHYLVGAGIMQMALNGIHGLLVCQDSRPAATTLAERIDQWIAAESDVVQCLRVELCTYSLKELDRLADCSSLEALVDKLLERHYANEESAAARTTNGRDDERRQAWQRRGILDLLAGHPAPFDDVATARLLGRTVADRILDLQPSGWLDLSRRFRRLVRALRQSRYRARRQLWPAQLTFSESRSDRQRSARQPPSREELASARGKMRSVPNVLGVLVTEALLPADIWQHERQRRNRLRLARAAVGELRGQA